MNNKKIILGLIFLIFISISAVSAAENTTDIAAVNDVQDDNAIGDELLKVSSKDSDALAYEDSDKYCQSDVDDEYVIASADDVAVLGASNYQDSSKSPVKLKAYKISSKTNKYTTLKATVKDKWNSPIKQGNVKFIINGKSYTVKVKNGVATKKIKLSKAKTYNYKAIFTAKNYKTKTVSSKVVVKKATPTHTIKKAGYTFKVSDSQYKKIQYVKNHKRASHLSTYANFKVKTNKYHNGMPVYAIVTTWSGIRSGQYYNWPQVQFVVMYGPDTWDWDYLTVHYNL